MDQAAVVETREQEAEEPKEPKEPKEPNDIIIDTFKKEGNEYAHTDHISSNKMWGDNPDRSYTTLKWLSLFGGLFGIDHFYLRSPYTGIAKMLTMGGFGLWWLFDCLQVWTEKDRIIEYGIEGPMTLGIARGMITDKPITHGQRSQYHWWIIAALFSFLGADSALLGNWGQMVRKQIEFILFLAVTIPTVVALQTTGFDGFWDTVGILIGLYFCLLFGSIVVGSWATSAYTAFSDPKALMTEGIKIDASYYDFLNYFKAWTDSIYYVGVDNDAGKAQVLKDVAIGSIPADYFNEQFRIQPLPFPKQSAAPYKDKLWHWGWSLFYAVLGPFIVSGQWVVSLFTAAYTASLPFLAIQSQTIPMAVKLFNATTEKTMAEAKLAEAEVKQKLAEMEEREVTAAAMLQKSLETQAGGGVQTSTEGWILGAVVLAIAAGGAFKGLIDYLMVE